MHRQIKARGHDTHPNRWTATPAAGGGAPSSYGVPASTAGRRSGGPGVLHMRVGTSVEVMMASGRILCAFGFGCAEGQHPGRAPGVSGVNDSNGGSGHPGGSQPRPDDVGGDQRPVGGIPQQDGVGLCQRQ